MTSPRTTASKRVCRQRRREQVLGAHVQAEALAGVGRREGGGLHADRLPAALPGLRPAGSRPSSRGPAVARRAVGARRVRLDAGQRAARRLALAGLLLDVVLRGRVGVGLAQLGVGGHRVQLHVAAARRSGRCPPARCRTGRSSGSARPGPSSPATLQVGVEPRGAAGGAGTWHSWRGSRRPTAHATPAPWPRRESGACSASSRRCTTRRARRGRSTSACAAALDGMTLGARHRRRRLDGRDRRRSSREIAEGDPRVKFVDALAQLRPPDRAHAPGWTMRAATRS